MAPSSRTSPTADDDDYFDQSRQTGNGRRGGQVYPARTLDRVDDDDDEDGGLAYASSGHDRGSPQSTSPRSSHRRGEVHDEPSQPGPPPYDPVNQLNMDSLRINDHPSPNTYSPADHANSPSSSSTHQFPPPRGASAMGYNNQAYEPPPRGASAMGYQTYEPIARTGTSMSLQSARHPPSSGRHAAALPSAPNQWVPPRQYAPPPQHNGYYNSDSASIRSFDRDPARPQGGPSPRQSNYDGSDIYDQYFDDTASVRSGHQGPPQNGGYQQGYGGPQMGQPYYPQQQYDPYGYQAQYGNQYGGGYGPGGPQHGYGPPQGYGPGPHGPPSSYEPSLYGSSASASEMHGPRPGLERAGTTLSNMTLTTKKTKAIDLSQQPYTKEYVDSYRTRIKADPDPDAHFQYAKYLIECAKHIGTSSADQKAVRKYRESLVAEALKVVRRLATQGEAYAEAQFFLANCCGTGMLGLPVDHERAYHLYLQAVKQNHPAATYRVAVCNEIGAGTKRDFGRAFNFFSRAAALGDTAAMYKLGMILLHGSMGQQKDPRQAIGWIKRAAEQADEENPHALHELGLLHEMPNSSVVVHDEAYAKDLFTRAAQLGYTQSQFKLGTCYEYGTLTCPVDPRRSIAWYTKAAEKGDPEAELALSGWYLTGSEGVLKQSDSEAYLWARKAANKGLSKAEYAVGYYAEVGIGVKQDIEFAKRWYMRAAAQGNKRAMQRLTELKRQGNRRVPVARPTRQQATDEGCIVM